MKKYFDQLKNEYQRNNRDLGLHLQAVKAMTVVMKKKHGVDVDWIYDATRKSLDAKTNTALEDRAIGLIAALLVAHGSSFNQAKFALCDWLNFGESKVKGAYRSVCTRYNLPRNKKNLENKEFLKAARYCLVEFPEIITKDFPDRYERAYEAFKKVQNFYQTYLIRRYAAKAYKDAGIDLDIDTWVDSFEVLGRLNRSN